MYTVRAAKKDDLPAIEKIYAYARCFMASTGNPNQWGTTNPPVKQLIEDIKMGNLYVVEDEKDIRGVFAFFLGNDPTYAYIEDGEWHCDGPYGTIHRVASDGSGGIFSAILGYAKSRMNYLRIDTHRDNKVMQHVLEKYDFRRCGIIYLANGSPRIAYDRT